MFLSQQINPVSLCLVTQTYSFFLLGILTLIAAVLISVKCQETRPNIFAQMAMVAKGKPRVSETNYCQAHEFDDLISCNLYSDYMCSFEFPGNCNVIFGNGIDEFSMS